MNIWVRFYILHRNSVALEEFVYLNEKENLNDYADEWSDRVWYAYHNQGIVEYEKDVLLPDRVLDELKEKYWNEIKAASQMLEILYNHKKQYLLK